MGPLAYRNLIVFSLFHYYNATAVALSSLYGFPVGPHPVTHRSGRSWALMLFFGHQDLVFNLFKGWLQLKKKHSKPVGCCLKDRQQQGKDLCYEWSQSDIISGVHTAPCTGQCWSWHRRETGWQPWWTALALIKEGLKKDHRRTLNTCQHYFFHSDMVHSGAIFITQILQLKCLCPLCCRFQIFSITPYSSHIYLWHSPTLDQAFLLFHSFDILPCIHLPLPLPLPFVPDYFPIIVIFSLTHTSWFICDHSLFWHADEFPSGHRQRSRRWFQQACPSSRY